MESDPSDHAKVLALPPLILLVAVALGCALDFFAPIKFAPRPYFLPFGLIFFAVSMAFPLLAIREMRRARTEIDVRKATSTLVTTGVFKVSRNPIYLGMVLLCLALAFLINSLWFMLLTIPLALFLQKGAIEPEELYLEQKFGANYLRYKASVRRWI